MSRQKTMTQQINTMFQRSDMVQIDTGRYRHEEMEGFRDEHGRNPNAHEKGAFAITDGATFDKYKNEIKALANYCKENFGIKRLVDIQPQHISSFMHYKIDDVSISKNGRITDGISQQTANNYIKCFNKFDDMLNKAFGTNKDFSGVCKEMYDYAKEMAKPPNTETRAFNDPQAVINAMSDPRHQLIAEIQLNTGLRQNDANYIRLNPDGQTVYIRSKCGYRVENFQMPQNLYAKITEFAKEIGTKLDQNGLPCFRIADYKGYLQDLKQACNKVGEKYTGSHAFRHNYAKASFDRHLKEGKTVHEAKQEVSNEMFHGREDVVENYLR